MLMMGAGPGGSRAPRQRQPQPGTARPPRNPISGVPPETPLFGTPFLGTPFRDPSFKISPSGTPIFGDLPLNLPLPLLPPFWVPFLRPLPTPPTFWKPPFRISV